MEQVVTAAIEEDERPAHHDDGRVKEFAEREELELTDVGVNEVAVVSDPSHRGDEEFMDQERRENPDQENDTRNQGHRA